MAVRSSPIFTAPGVTSLAPVSVFTCPSGVVAVCKQIVIANFTASPSGAANLLYQPSGGTAVACASGFFFAGPNNFFLSLLFVVLLEGDELLANSPDGSPTDFAAWGANLLA